jgi:hypothetical protein
MALLRFLWRVARRRWVMRLLLWLAVRLVRLFGWRRSVKLVFRQRRRFRFVAVGMWRATVGLLRFGMSAWILIGWIRKHGPRALGHGKGTLRSQVSPELGRLRAADPPWPLDRRRHARTNFSSRLARRRDELRRSVLVAVGVDPGWRPKRKPPRPRHDRN